MSPEQYPWERIEMGTDPVSRLGVNREKWDSGETRLDNFSYKIAFELDFFCQKCINLMSGNAIPSLLPFYLTAFGR